ncbi:cytochrome c [Pseudorhodobacter sp. W20_MBD10_FR17]|uniref:c-type cytochrome n=1 Tax=Pseudorhodobacter sp. W20_MBD10_FR17 TaxID=3240266 RepID=UPI003F9C454F
MKIHSIIITSLCAAVLSACTWASTSTHGAAKRGQVVYAKECSQCHGPRGEGAGIVPVGAGVVPPNLTVLKQRNDGIFPRDFVRRFVMGVSKTDNRSVVMPKFAFVGLRHVYPNGGADGEVLEADFDDLLDYLEAIQE